MTPDDPHIVEGTITAVEAIKKRAGRVAVYVDGIFAMELGATLVAERGVRKGERLTPERAGELREEDRRRSAFARALNLLTYRGRTIDEIRTRLHAAGYPHLIIDEVVEKLVRLGYLDDAAFAERFARSRLVNKAQGPRRIQGELKRLGVHESIVDARMQQIATTDEVGEAARRAGAKYWRRLSREADPRRRRWKFVQYLVRRGFDVDQANAAFEVVASEQDSE